MKPVKFAAFVLTLAVPVIAMAQPPEGRRPEGGPPEGGFFGGGAGREGGRRMPNPLLDALDADKNGELSTEEIANATAALKSLDKNSDGKLDVAEMRPNFEGMGRGGFGQGPGGEGGQGSGSEEMLTRLMAMDANKDGKLAKDELPERLQSMFARGDKNEDGSMDKEEVMAFARERSGGQSGQGGPGGPGFGGGDFVGQMMERADSDKDGKLSGDEIPPFMKERLQQIDTNKDGALDKAELEAGAAKMREGRGDGRGQGPGRAQRPPVEGDSDGKQDGRKSE